MIRHSSKPLAAPISSWLSAGNSGRSLRTRKVAVDRTMIDYIENAHAELNPPYDILNNRWRAG
jgi:hypothetical protein